MYSLLLQVNNLKHNTVSAIELVNVQLCAVSSCVTHMFLNKSHVLWIVWKIDNLFAKVHSILCNSWERASKYRIIRNAHARIVSADKMHTASDNNAHCRDNTLSCWYSTLICSNKYFGKHSRPLKTTQII